MNCIIQHLFLFYDFKSIFQCQKCNKSNIVAENNIAIWIGFTTTLLFEIFEDKIRMSEEEEEEMVCEVALLLKWVKR